MASLPQRRFRFTILLVLGFVAILAEVVYLQTKYEEQIALAMEVPPPPPAVVDYTLLPEPTFTTASVVSGISNPWDMAFVSYDTFFYNLRAGEVHGHNLTTGADWVVAKPEDVYVRGEGGLLGLLVDKEFEQNKYIYTCLNVQGGPTISVVRWTVSEDLLTAAERKDIITGLPSNVSGRHSGCRLAMGMDGFLWVGTGDTGVGTYPQDPSSLGGKVLRVTRDGDAVPGNMEAPFDTRIFNFGHRNVQGIALFSEPIDGVYGFTSEHGSGVDDEVNLLKPGNFGWDPIPGYNESTEMTDLVKFPDAVPEIWSSGAPTIAVSGLTIVKGEEWGAWTGAVLLAVQKDQHVRLLRFDSDYNLVQERMLLDQFGRIRTIVQGPDHALYLLTDNGGGEDAIIRVSRI